MRNKLLNAYFHLGLLRQRIKTAWLEEKIWLLVVHV